MDFELTERSIRKMDADSLHTTHSYNTTLNTTSSGRHSRDAGLGRMRPLTIKQVPKIERVLNKKTRYHHRPSITTVIFKWLATIVTGGILLTCVTWAKMSTIALSERMHTSDTSDDGRKDATRIFVMLQLIAIIPHAINLARAVFNSAFRPDLPWPKKKALVLAVVISALEAFGLCLYIFKMAAVTSPAVSILVMSCVFIGPVLDNMLVSIIRGSGRESVKLQHKLVFVVAFMLELTGLVLTGIHLYKELEVNLATAWIPPVAIVCLAVSWTPTIQVYLLGYDEELDESVGTEDDIDDQHEASTQPDTSSHSMHGHRTGFYTANGSGVAHVQQAGEEESRARRVQSRSAWRLSAWMSFWKLVFTAGFSMLIFFTMPPDGKFSTYTDGWGDWGGLEKDWAYMIGNIGGSIIGYYCGYMACTACMQKLAFSVPLAIFAPFLAFFLLAATGSCDTFISSDSCSGEIVPLLIVALVALVIAQTLSTGWVLFKTQSMVMLKQDQLFWTPMYNPVLLDQWLMLARKTELYNEDYENPIDKAKRSKVIICTTMYREEDIEMRQLLESIRKIDQAQSAGKRHFEAHVFFDGAVKNMNPTEFPLQLVSLVKEVLDVEPLDCTRTMTPYGMCLTWILNGDMDKKDRQEGQAKKGMYFKIHLKDNIKVKNKKRWSQVMYMSYVLDFLMEQERERKLSRDYMSYVLDFLMEQERERSDEDWFILTTDADVKFTPDSVEALLDLMTRDPTVGAVCARTHPLGSGPLLWYQIFEYAIGHWFQKAAEHVIGSVLCSPGCFSVYRCKAIRDILPQYSTNVSHAFEFLTKDMGEDRWFCTLLVQSGWRIEYCAASENSTHCPTEFEEFFKQRRRWVASTIANLMLLVREWNIISRLNHRVSRVFLLYQTILLFATLIGPSSIILVVSGGVRYAYPSISATVVVVVQILTCLLYTAVCLLTSSKTQLNTGKALTFLYAVIMAIVMVGTAVQVASDFDGDKNMHNFISRDIRFSTTTVYLGSMVALFILTGLLHLTEITALLHGIWFFLCMPAGYLILMIYSICNITDRSWGTREEKTHQVRVNNASWQEKISRTFKSIFFCCFKTPTDMKTVEVQTDVVVRRSRSTSGTETFESLQQPESLDQHSMMNFQPSIHRSREGMSIITEESVQGPSYVTALDDDDDDVDEDTVMKVEDWLPPDMKNLADDFKKHGFENSMFISKMTEKELKDIGVKSRAKKQALVDMIKRLPDYEIEAEVPKNIEDWLEKIGLEQYLRNFKKEHIIEAKDMEVLKSFGRTEIEKELNIKKIGHIKRLLYAIEKLRNPTESERRVLEIRNKLVGTKIHKLKDVNVEEHEFWESLKAECLLPMSTAYGLEEDLKGKLGDLRTQWLMVFAVSNTLWMVLIYTLADQGQLLSVFGSNPVGLVVLILFSFVLFVQFLAMIIHRISTLTHFLGRAPYRLGDTYNTAWAFSDSDMKSHERPQEDLEAIMARQYTRDLARSRIVKRHSIRRQQQSAAPAANRDPDETTPLVLHENV